MINRNIRDSAGRTPEIYGRTTETRYALTKIAPTKCEQGNFEPTGAAYRAPVKLMRKSERNTRSLRGQQHLLTA